MPMSVVSATNMQTTVCLCLPLPYIDTDHCSGVSSTYACLFGLSSAVPGLSHGLVGWNLGQHYSYVVGTGPDDRAYWLLATNLGKTYHGANIPCFTEEDKERIVQEHWNDRITPDLRMSDLYKAKQHLVCTPLRETEYRKWSLGRMIVLGDASHTVRKLPWVSICVPS